MYIHVHCLYITSQCIYMYIVYILLVNVYTCTLWHVCIIGTLGFITEVTMRIRPLPEVRRYGSIVFHSFELGVKFMREVARQVSICT